MTKEQVVELMKNSASEQEWNKNCDKVKQSNDGKYPDFWYKEIVMSGLASETAGKWGGNAGIRIQSL